MTKSKDTVTRFLHRREDFGLLFRHEYDVLPGYGETGDVISVAKWVDAATPHKGGTAAKAKRRRAHR